MVHLLSICRRAGVAFFLLTLETSHPAITFFVAVALIELILWGASLWREIQRPRRRFVPPLNQDNFGPLGNVF